MAKIIGFQIHKQNEPKWERFSEVCATLNTNPNAVLNALIPNLSEAIKLYNPKTRKLDANLGVITLK
jgi:hypothetical protein